MAKPKEPKKPQEHDERPRVRRAGRERAVHEEIVARRLEGGAPPTPEAYARALEEWQQLPGSVVRPPTDVTPPAQPPKEPPQPGSSADDADDKKVPQ